MTEISQPKADQTAGGVSQPRVLGVRHGMFGVPDAGDTTGYGGLVENVVFPGASPRPYGSWFDEAVDVLGEVLTEQGSSFDEAVAAVVVDRDELTLHVRREHLLTVAQILRDDEDLRFEMSVGTSGAHYPGESGTELHAVTHIVSVTHNRMMRLEVSCPDEDPHVPSLTGIWPGSDWHERETYDFFGIVFDGHPGLTRSHMPDDWVGHPQRKDYPLGGIPVEYRGASIPPPDQRRSYS
jgi:NADH-quinone oxidoreductase subunit C